MRTSYINFIRTSRSRDLNVSVSDVSRRIYEMSRSRLVSWHERLVSIGLVTQRLVYIPDIGCLTIYKYHYKAY